MIPPRRCIDLAAETIFIFIPGQTKLVIYAHPLKECVIQFKTKCLCVIFVFHQLVIKRKRIGISIGKIQRNIETA